MMLARELVLLLLFGAAVAAVPTELYFSPVELVRIAGYGEERVSSVFISGRLACDVCLRPGSGLLSFDVAGAKVRVACQNEGSRKMVHAAFATTDDYGNFTIDLPSRLHATPILEKACVVRLLHLPAGSACLRRLRRRRSSYGFRLSSSENGVRRYTTGVIRLMHNDIPSHKCVQKEDPSDEN